MTIVNRLYNTKDVNMLSTSATIVESAIGKKNSYRKREASGPILFLRTSEKG